MKIPLSRVIFTSIFAILFFIGPFMPRYILFLINEILLWSIFAMAYDLSFGYAGMLSFGHGVFFGLGNYGAAILVKDLRMNLFIAILFGVILATIAGFGIGYITRARGTRGPQFAILTFIITVTAYLVSLTLSWITGGIDGISFATPTVHLGMWELSLSSWLVRYYFSLVAFIASFLILCRVKNSPFGIVLLAIRENEERARFAGYNTTKYAILAFAISALFAGFAGAIYGLEYGYANPTFFQVNISLNAILWSYFGGSGTLFGPIVGTVILLPIVDYISKHWAYYWIAVGALLIIVVIKFPSGIMGHLQELVHPSGEGRKEIA